MRHTFQIVRHIDPAKGNLNGLSEIWLTTFSVVSTIKFKTANLQKSFVNLKLCIHNGQ